MLYTSSAELVAKKKLAGDVYLFSFRLKDQVFSAASGQYLIFFIPNETKNPYRRLYSIASNCSNLSTFQLVVKIIPGGVASEYFNALQVGGMTTVQGPAGVFTIKNRQKDMIFLATGTGIAPIKVIIEDLLKGAGPKPNIKLLWGLKQQSDVYFFEDFKKLADQNKNFSFQICLSRETSLDLIPEEMRGFYHMGRITDVYKNLEALKTSDCYICGDKAVVEAIRQDLATLGVSKESIIFEKF